MISPVGTWMVRWHSTLVTNHDPFIAGVVGMTRGPAPVVGAIALILAAVRAQNDARARHDLPHELVRIALLIFCCTSLDFVHIYGRDAIFLGMPSWLAAQTSSMGSAVVAVADANSVASALDALYAKSMIFIAQAEQRGSGLVSSFGAEIAKFASAGCIWLVAIIVTLTEWTLALLIDCLPIAALFNMLRTIFGSVLARWAAKVAAVLLVMFLSFIVMQVTLGMENQALDEFLAHQAQADAEINALPLFDIQGRLRAVAAASATASADLVAMVGYLAASVLMLISLPAIAYTLFPGMPTNHAGAAVAGAVLGLRQATDAMRAVGGALGRAQPPSLPSASMPSPPNYSLSMAQRQLPPPRPAAVAPPPPPPLLTH